MVFSFAVEFLSLLTLGAALAYSMMPDYSEDIRRRPEQSQEAGLSKKDIWLGSDDQFIAPVGSSSTTMEPIVGSGGGGKVLADEALANTANAMETYAKWMEDNANGKRLC